MRGHPPYARVRERHSRAHACQSRRFLPSIVHPSTVGPRVSLSASTLCTALVSANIREHSLRGIRRRSCAYPRTQICDRRWWMWWRTWSNLRRAIVTTTACTLVLQRAHV
ncbi:hypothetical protein C8Q78DRAFT_406475 [Trametes maxima]|nr:hypothetical protein C8Q78DRAFT_406475 [Trametes maxima]